MSQFLRPRLRYVVWLTLGFLVLLAFLCRESLLIAAGQWLDVGRPPMQTRYVLVLAGDESTRPFAGAALLRSGYVQQALLISAVAGPQEADGDRPATGQVARTVFESLGAPPERLFVLPGRSNSTFGDAKLLKAFLQTEPDGRVTIVTSHYHTRRSRWVFRRVLGPMNERVHFVSCPTDGYDLTNWHRSKQGVAACGSEYMKLLIYLFLYGDGLWWGVGGVLVFGSWRSYRAYLQRRRRDFERPRRE